MLFNTAVLCSVNTLLFNGNPLLRFDGYFLLSDALRIPNLASRSSAAVREFFQTLLPLVRNRCDFAILNNHENIILLLLIPRAAFLFLSLLQLGDPIAMHDLARSVFVFSWLCP